MKFIKLNLILLFIFSLSACVTDSARPVEPGAVAKPELIEVDSDIEDEFNTALSYLKSEKYAEAIVLLEKIIAVENRVPAPFVNLGMAYEKTGDDKNAEKYLRQALGLELTHPVANNQLGLLYRRLGRFDDARKAYTNALTEYPDYLPVVKNLGILCDLYLRDFPCALQQFEHYLSIRPDDKTMKIWLADLSRRVK
jgi:Tfp pilus assembly protein PilF